MMKHSDQYKKMEEMYLKNNVLSRGQTWSMKAKLAQFEFRPVIDRPIYYVEILKNNN